MRIAIASSGLGHVARGVEVWAHSLALGLAARGVDVTLFASAPLAAAPVTARTLPCLRRDDPRAECWAKRMPGWTWRWGLKDPYGWEQNSFWWHLWPELRRGGFDLLHVQDPMVADRCRQFERMGVVKTQVILAHGTEEPLDFLRRFPHLQELSPCYQARHGGELPRGFTRHSIPNFVDTGRFAPADRRKARVELGLPQEGFLVLSVGAVNRSHKRMDWLIGEFARWNHPGSTLVIAGECGGEGRQLAEEARDKLRTRFLLLENLPHSQMARVYCAADLFVLCSLQELFGIAFLEAMACGIPCIGHTNQVTEWILGEAGMTVDMQVPGALAAAIAEYRHAPELCARRGLSARQRAVDCFSSDVVIPQIVAMYETILKKGIQGTHWCPRGTQRLKPFRL